MSGGLDATIIGMPEGAARIERSGNIAFIIIDNPPVNASSWRVRSDLLSALAACAADTSLAGVVLTGAGAAFMAGADIKEFDAPLRDPQMPAVIAAVESLHAPVVAAINGPALGAGYELALGCDARIASHTAVVGLPEVTLGVIPGAGGTQRLPRLVGVAEAIDLIANGRRVKAAEALAAGMIDAIASNDLRTEAAELARSLAGAKRRLRDRATPASEQSAIDEAAARAIAKSRGSNAVAQAVESIRRAASTGFDEALAAERAAFQTLRESREAAARRYLFFAERDAFRVSGIEGGSARKVASVGVIGAGTMGAAIAMCFLDAGLPVTLVERDQTALEAGVARIASGYKRMVESGRIDETQAKRRLDLIVRATDLGALADVDLAVEAIFEDMAVKQALFRDLDRTLKAGAIIASNTSYLDLDVLARETSRPADVIGLHFFAPANVMPSRSRSRRGERPRRAGHSARNRTQDTQAAGRRARRRGFHRQPYLLRLSQAMRVHGGGGLAAARGGRRLVAFRLRDGAVRGCGPVRPRYRVAHASTTERHARPEGALLRRAGQALRGRTAWSEDGQWLVRLSRRRATGCA